MSNARKFLSAAAVAIPALPLAAPGAGAEIWRSRGHDRPVIGVHSVNSDRGHEARRHGQDGHRGTRRHHRPLFDFMPHRPRQSDHR